MKTIFYTAFYGLVVITGLCPWIQSIAQCVGPYGQDPTKWERTFTEEFNGSSLNMSVWNNAVWYGSSDPVINYTVENGLLKIWPDQGFKNRTIDTDGKYSQTYGYYEAKMKLNIGKGCWPAFWLYAHPGNDRPEIDIMEAYPGVGPSSGWGDANLHPVNYGLTLHKANGDYSWHEVPYATKYTDFNPPIDFSAAFHIYGVNWTATTVTFYLDGIQVGPTHNYSDNYWNKPMYILLDLWFGSASGTPNTSETPMGKSNSFEIDYVRAWKAGVCNGPPAAPNSLFCNASSSPVVDGVAESVWDNIKSDTLNNVRNLAGIIASVSDMSATYKSTWDNSGLYLLVNVKDDLLNNDSGANTWDDDGIEIFIDGNNDKATTYDGNDRQYILRYNDANVYEYINTVAQPVNPAGVTFAQGTSPGGYLMEIKITWSALGVTPAQGKLLGFEIHANDDDDGSGAEAKLMWYSTVDQSATNPSTFGTIKLDSASCGGVTTGISGNTSAPLISVHPNPSNGTFILSISSEISLENTVLKITDLAGKEIKNIFIQNYESSINSGELQSGIYFYSIFKQSERLAFGKLCIQ